MPLIVPQVSESDLQNWKVKLMGKTLGEEHNETTFKQNDLPKGHRIVKSGSVHTTDYSPDRLNVHVNDDGIVENVAFN